MKMPETVDGALFAPCGMNCLVCYKHCAHKKPCAGCLAGEQGKPAHCRACALRDCVRERDLTYCYECGDYPCKRIKNLEKTYRTRYGTSLMENSEQVRILGLAAFLDGQRARYTCPACGGIISLHDRACGECGRGI